MDRKCICKLGKIRRHDVKKYLDGMLKWKTHSEKGNVNQIQEN